MPLTSDDFQDQGPESGGSWETRQELPLGEQRRDGERPVHIRCPLDVCPAYLFNVFYCPSFKDSSV